MDDDKYGDDEGEMMNKIEKRTCWRDAQVEIGTDTDRKIEVTVI